MTLVHHMRDGPSHFFCGGIRTSQEATTPVKGSFLNGQANCLILLTLDSFNLITDQFCIFYGLGLLSKLSNKRIQSMIQLYDNQQTGSWRMGKWRSFFAFPRKSVFAHLNSPATDFLGFFIFAFSMQNSNFPYISFPLKKCDI